MKRRSLKLFLTLSVMALALSGCSKEGDAAYKEGINALTVQEYDVAVEKLNEACEAGSDRERTMRALGLAYMGEERYSEAVLAFKEALKAAGTSTGELECDINYYMAVSLSKLGEYDEAISRLDAVIALRPADRQALVQRGQLELFLGDKETAKADFDKAVAVKKSDAGIYIDIYDAYVKRGMESEGAEYLNAARNADAGKLNDLDKGRLCFYTGDYEGACNYLEYARSTQQSGPELIGLLGRCYCLREKYENATAIYLGYLEENPDPAIYNELGLCYVNEGDYASAADAFHNGSEIKEKNTYMQILKHNEIVCLEYMGEYEQAAALAAEYIDTYGDEGGLMSKEYDFLYTR